MKNLKKMLSVIVVVAMLVTTMLPAFAADTAAPKTDAEIAKGLGVVIGGTTGVDETYLKASTQRYQAAIIFLRLLGLESKAKVFDGKENFADAKLLNADMQKYIAYLKANPQYGWLGIGNNKFDPMSVTSAQAFYKVLLEALGYKCTVGDVKGDFEYKDTIAFAAEKGLTKVANIAKFTNADLVTAVLEALAVEVKDTGKTLLKTLVDSKVISEDIAKEFLPDALEVKKNVTTEVYGVTATNGQLTVVMSEDVGATPAAADFAVTQAINGGAATTVTATVYGYTYATKTAVINVPTVAATDAEQSIVYGVSYKGGKVVNAPALVVAGTLKVDSAAYVNAGQFTVKFTAPVDKDSATNKDNYSLDSGITIAAVSLADDKKTVTVTTSSGTPLASGTTYNVTVSTGVKSAAGVALKESATKSFSGSDASIPSVLSVVAKGNTAAKITFSEPINAVVLTTLTNYKINTVIPSASITASADNTSVEIEAPLTSENTLEIIAGNTLTDYAGNKVLAGSYKFNVSAPKAVTQAVSATFVNQNTIQVAFDDLVKLTDATSYSTNFYWNTNGADGYKQYTADSYSAGVSNTFTKVDDKTFKINFTGTSNYVQAGKIYFFVEGLKDYYDNSVPTKKFELTATADSVATLTKSEATSESQIELTFDKAINTDTVSTSNVTLKNSSGTAVSLNSINYVAADKKIVIGFDTQAGGNYTVTISNLKTTTGNTISTQTVTVAITDKTPISSISINAVDTGATGDYAIIKFPESMATTGSFSIGDKGKYSVDVDGTAYAALAPADTLTVVDDKTVKIAFTGSKFNAAQVLNVKVTLVADKAGNINGSAVTGSGTVLGSTAKLDLSADVTAVKITDLRTIKVVVNRLMNAVSASDFRIVDGSTEIYPAQVAYANEADGTGTATITITVSNDLDTSKAYTVKTIAAVGGTKDASDLNFADAKVTGNADNYIAPNLKSVSVINSTTLRLVFDKLLVIKTGGDFTVKVGDTAYTTSTLTQVTGPVYDLAVAAFDINATPVVRTIAAPQSEDSFGNKLVANTTGVTAKNARVQKVVLSKGAVAATIGADETIAITFDTAIDPGSISSGWSGSSALTGNTVAGDDSDETLTIAGVGVVTFTGNVVDEDFSLANAKYELSADKKTLTITLTGAADTNIAAAGGGYQAAFAVANTVKNSDGTYYNAGDSIITGSSLK
jgi:hypothetical protein